MDLNTWNWAFTQIVSALVSAFGYAVQAAGVATGTILALIFVAALVRLIVRPILGMQNYGGNSDDIRKARSVARERQENKSKYGV